MRYIVLGLLRGREKLYGYALATAFRDLTGLPLNSGNLYRELRRLAEQGLVQPSESSPEADLRRVHYEITAAGEEEFDAWFGLVSDSAPTTGDDELSLRTAFAAGVDPLAARRLFDRWRDELWFRSQVLERERKTELSRAAGAEPGHFPARASLLGRRLRHVVADLEFLDEVRTTYEGWVTATRRAPAPPPAVAAQRVRRRGRAAGRR